MLCYVVPHCAYVRLIKIKTIDGQALVMVVAVVVVVVVMEGLSAGTPCKVGSKRGVAVGWLLSGRANRRYSIDSIVGRLELRKGNFISPSKTDAT
jgi:hypothetical protein